MKQLRRPSVFIFTATVVFSLLSRMTSDAATKPASPSQASTATAIAKPIVANTSFGKTVPGKSTVSPALLAQTTGNLLSPEQTAKLTRLPIPVVAPTELPAGFRLVHADGEINKYANGDDDSGYAIDYEGDNNTCLSVRSSQDGPRGLGKVKQVQTRFGSLTVYEQKWRDSKSLISFLGLKGNPVLISGGTLLDSKAVGGWKRCRTVSLETYTQVLKSLAVVK